MKVILAEVVDYDGRFLIGVFSNREKAMSASIKYLLGEGTYPKGVCSEYENYISYYINESPEVLAFKTFEVDKTI